MKRTIFIASEFQKLNFVRLCGSCDPSVGCEGYGQNLCSGDGDKGRVNSFTLWSESEYGLDYLTGESLESFNKILYRTESLLFY